MQLIGIGYQVQFGRANATVREITKTHLVLSNGPILTSMPLNMAETLAEQGKFSCGPLDGLIEAEKSKPQSSARSKKSKK